MNRSGLTLLGALLIVFATSQTLKINPYGLKPGPKDLSPKQIYGKALTWLRALDKDLKGKYVSVSLKSILSEREWTIVTGVGKKSDGNLLLDGKGDLQYYRDTDIELEQRFRPQTATSNRNLPLATYTARIKKFLALAGFKQEFTPIRFGNPRRGRIGTFIYDLYRGVPVRDNSLSFTLRARDGAFGYVSRRFATAKFDPNAKVDVSEADAKEAATKAWAKGDKIREFKLWYARPRKGWMDYTSEVAKLYYIARYKDWGEVWVDAGSGKVAWTFKPDLKRDHRR